MEKITKKEKKEFVGYDLSGLPFFFWIPYLIVSFFRNFRKNKKVGN